MATTQDDAQIVGIDQSSPSKSERQSSLEKHLHNRPEAQDLKERHILLDTTAASTLQARQAELERQMITDNLKKGLSKRPERDQLIERNILPDSSAAPGIQGQQKELEKSMKADNLDRALQQRPQKETLVREGILKKD